MLIKTIHHDKIAGYVANEHINMFTATDVNWSGGAKTITIKEEVTSALVINDGTYNWLQIDAGVATRRIRFGNSTGDPDPDYQFLGSGLTTLGGNLLVDGGDIGITADEDLLQLASGALTVNGTIGSGAITCTALDAGAGLIQTTGQGTFGDVLINAAASTISTTSGDLFLSPAGNDVKIRVDNRLLFGTSSELQLQWSSSGLNHADFGTGGMIVMYNTALAPPGANRAADPPIGETDIALRLFAKSATAPHNKYIQFWHDITNGNISTGVGDLNLVPIGSTVIKTGLVGSVDGITATSAGVAASIVTINTEVTTNDDDDLDNVTLANGVSGQIKHIYCVASFAGDTWKITPATMAGGTQITFGDNSVGNGCTLVYADSEGWVVVANNGGTIS